ncbi:hypothetical protein DUNSADRAFT_1752 [Dunaliella salina]|uniref:Uncharacterized protein n=1 Tax=Dunaliella salina TaxID=3046 RepID=A0ABQ7FX42_DUNSA|nr:hypothetical protein DUNSADRAFT_1752 [Dunaliella salina]|eukprot:KAF5826923.1 hypothetical protein DUNSADRAFT_1752 [Dunaliella salina]
MNGHKDMCQLLLSKGATVDKACTNGATPLQMAVMNGHEDVVLLLQKNGAMLDTADSRAKERPAVKASNPDSGVKHGEPVVVRPYRPPHLRQKVSQGQEGNSCRPRTSNTHGSGASNTQRPGPAPGPAPAPGPGLGSKVWEGASAAVRSAIKTRDVWLSAKQVVSGKDFSQVEDVLHRAEEFYQHAQQLRRAVSSGQKSQPAFSLEDLQEEWKVEDGKLANFTVLGQVHRVLNGLNPHLLSFVGLGGLAIPVANIAVVLGAVMWRTRQASHMSQNCGTLLELLKHLDTRLLQVFKAKVDKKMAYSHHVGDALLDLFGLFLEGGSLVQDFLKANFWSRLLQRNEAKFGALEGKIRKAMEKIPFELSMDILAGEFPRGRYHDEAAGLRSAVCSAADLPEEKAPEALSLLSQKSPSHLKELLVQHGTFSDKVISSIISTGINAIAGQQVLLAQQQESMAEEQESLKGRLLTLEDHSKKQSEELENVKAVLASMGLSSSSQSLN